METKIKKSWIAAAALTVCLIAAVPGIFFYRQGVFEEETEQQEQQEQQVQKPVRRWTLDEMDEAMGERYGEGIVRISVTEEGSENPEPESGKEQEILTAVYSPPS